MAYSTSPVSTAAPVSQWGDLFKNILGTVVDTGAKVAIAKLDAKQAATVAEQEQAKATILAQVQTTAANNNAATVQKFALIGGAVLIGITALIILSRSK